MADEARAEHVLAIHECNLIIIPINAEYGRIHSRTAIEGVVSACTREDVVAAKCIDCVCQTGSDQRVIAIGGGYRSAID